MRASRQLVFGDAQALGQDDAEAVEECRLCGVGGLQFRRRGRYLAMATEVSVDDRFRIQDVLRSYVWANDWGSVEAVVAAFTPDGIVQPATGERIPVRRWASETFAQPGRRGRQHWVQHIIFERTADGVTVRS